MKEPVRIFSDLHLGHKISRIREVETLRPLINGAATVVFNGDTWQELAKPFYERSRTMLDALETLCREEGAEAVFLSGNHDPGWPGPGCLTLAEERIVITHGDALLFDGSPWKREILNGHQRVREMWARFPTASEDVSERLEVAREIARELRSTDYPTGRSLLQRAWDAVVPPQRALRMIESWITQAVEGADFCKRYFPKAEFLVIGHFHREGSWLRRGVRVINTGSFMAPGQAHWVEWDQGMLRRGLIRETPARNEKGTILDAWRL